MCWPGRCVGLRGMGRGGLLSRGAARGAGQQVNLSLVPRQGLCKRGSVLSWSLGCPRREFDRHCVKKIRRRRVLLCILVVVVVVVGRAHDCLFSPHCDPGGMQSSDVGPSFASFLQECI